MAARRPARRRPTRPQQVRIIGGDWRRRQIPVPDAPGLRPTGDRVRETLFNWLAPRLPGARCLDLFAGTGVLGMEALSRGAAHCCFVESEPAIATALQDQLAQLGGRERATVVNGAAPQMLSRCPGPFDCVFLDPPFGAGLLQPTLDQLVPYLAPGHRVYIEYGTSDTVRWSSGWQSLRDGRAGQVRYHLLEFQPSTDSPKETP